jgi:hypothetical protein
VVSPGIERRTGEEDGGTQIIIIPTHLKVQDTLFRFGQVKVTARQFVLLLAGGSLNYTLWIRTAWLETSFAVLGTGVHWSLVAVCCVVLLALAFGNIADRTLDIWCLLLLVYWLRPRVYVWSNLRWEPEIGQAETATGEEEVGDEGKHVITVNTYA